MRFEGGSLVPEATPHTNCVIRQTTSMFTSTKLPLELSDTRHCAKIRDVKLEKPIPHPQQSHPLHEVREIIFVPLHSTSGDAQSLGST